MVIEQVSTKETRHMDNLTIITKKSKNSKPTQAARFFSTAFNRPSPRAISNTLNPQAGYRPIYEPPWYYRQIIVTNNIKPQQPNNMPAISSISMINKNIPTNAAMRRPASSTKKKTGNNNTPLPAVLPHLLFPKVTYRAVPEALELESKKLVTTEKSASSETQRNEKNAACRKTPANANSDNDCADHKLTSGLWKSAESHAISKSVGDSSIEDITDSFKNMMLQENQIKAESAITTKVPSEPTFWSSSSVNPFKFSNMKPFPNSLRVKGPAATNILSSTLNAISLNDLQEVNIDDVDNAEYVTDPAFKIAKPRPVEIKSKKFFTIEIKEIGSPSQFAFQYSHSSLQQLMMEMT